MPILVFFATFAVYLSTMAPSITVGDSGEFCAASVILGLCHSPGYPLFNLLGKVCTIIFPFASRAYRVNVMCALCGALTASLLYLCLKSLFEMYESKNAKAAGTSVPDGKGRSFLYLTATMLFAFSPAFWKASIQAEVFTLNTFFAVLIIYAIIKNRTYLAVFAFGLGLGNHHTLVFIAPAILAHIYALKPFNIKRLLLLALFFVMGFSIYVYLPIRASKPPSLNWGNPVTVEKFVRDITRADYGSLSLTVGEKIERNTANTFKELSRFAGSVGGQFTLFGLLAGIAGVYYGIKMKLSNFKSIVFVWALAGPGFMLLANMPFNPETEGILERFYILVNLFWAFIAAAGLYVLLKQFNAYARAAVFVLTAVLLVSMRLEAVSWRTYYLAYDYGKNIFRTLAPNAIFFMDGGDDTFYSTAYLQFAEGKRKDVELHDRGGLVFKSLYGPDFRMITKTEKEERRRDVERQFLAIRPIYFSTFNKEIMPGIKLEADGFLYTPALSGEAANVSKTNTPHLNPLPGGERQIRGINSFFAYAVRNVYDGQSSDYRSRSLAPLYPYFEAFYDTANSGRYQRYAFLAWPDAMWLEGNLKIEMLTSAYENYSKNRFAEAAADYENMLKYFPDDYDTTINLGVVNEKLHKYDKAIEYYNRAAALMPDKTDPYYNISVIYWQKADWENVVRYLNKMLQMNPNEPRARHYLPEALSKLKR